MLCDRRNDHTGPISPCKSIPSFHQDACGRLHASSSRTILLHPRIIDEFHDAYHFLRLKSNMCVMWQSKKHLLWQIGYHGHLEPFQFIEHLRLVGVPYASLLLGLVKRPFSTDPIFTATGFIRCLKKPNQQTNRLRIHAAGLACFVERVSH